MVDQARRIFAGEEGIEGGHSRTRRAGRNAHHQGGHAQNKKRGSDCKGEGERKKGGAGKKAVDDHVLIYVVA